MVVLAFAALYISWGTTYLAIREGVQDFPPFLFGGFRLLAAGLVLVAYLLLRREPLGFRWQDLGWTLLAAVLMFVGGNGLLSLAEQTLESAAAAVLGATTPLFLALIEVMWPGRDRLAGRGWLGLLVGLCGVLVIFAPQLGDPASLLQDAGPLLMLGSAFTWALGTVVAQRRRPRASLLAAAAQQMVLGGVALCVVGLVVGEGRQLGPESFTPRAVSAFAYLLVVGSLIGFVAFTWLMGHVSASLVGTYAYVNPCVAVLVGGLIAGETITFGIVSGMLIILFGVALVRSGGAHRLPDDEPENLEPCILLACRDRAEQNQTCRSRTTNDESPMTTP
jgi:drug/metabolite transporter (DMT)-like permease